MKAKSARWTDRQIELIIGALLRAGVILAASVVAIGAVIYLVRHGREPSPDLREFHGEQTDFRDVASIVRGIGDGKARAIVQLGIVMMIAIPVVRVAFSVWAFIEERDTLYVAVTLVVLAILCYSIFCGQGG